MMLFAFAVSTGCKKTPAPAGETMGSNHAGSAGSGMMANGSGMMATGSGSAGMAGSGSGSATTPVVPTSTDFEEQASKDVTDANLEAHLAAMEKQLAN